MSSFMTQSPAQLRVCGSLASHSRFSADQLTIGGQSGQTGFGGKAEKRYPGLLKEIVKEI